MKTITIKNAIKKYKWPKKKPFQCEITPNFDCNAKCVFCYSSPQLSNWQNRQLTLTQIAEYLKIGIKKGAWLCAITGGEVTTREDIFQIINIAKKIGYPVIELTTNGIKLEDFDYCQKLVDNGLNAIRFSLHSAIPSVHDKLIGVSGAWKKTIQAIENMIKLKIKIAINTAIIRENYKTLPELIYLLSDKYGIDSYSLVAAHYLGMLKVNMQKYSVSYTQIMPYLLKSLKIIREKIKILDAPPLSNFLPCLLPSCYRNLIAEWKTPEKDDILVLPDEGLKGIAGTKKSLSIKTEKCKKCIYYKICIGFEKEYYNLFGDKEFKPIKKENKNFSIKTIYGEL